MSSSTATAPDLDRVHAVTSNFFFWQGLRWVPLGVALIIAAMTPWLKATLGRPWGALISLVVVVVALWLSTNVLGDYYARAYGRVRGIPGAHKNRNTIKWFVVYPAMAAAVFLDWKFNGPFMISGVVFGISIEAYRRSTGGGRLHYVAAAILFALMSLAPAAGVSSSRGLLTPLLGMLGAVYVIGGLLDHRELVKILGPLQTDNDARTV